MRNFTKIVLSLAMAFGLLGGVSSVSATKLYATYGTPASSGSWESSTNTYTWTAASSNLMDLFTFGAGELANYQSLHFTTDNFTSVYRVCFMNGGTAVATIAFYSAGEKNLVFSERDEIKTLDLSTITSIKFGGSTESGSIKITKKPYLQKPMSLVWGDDGYADIDITDLTASGDFTLNDQTGELTATVSSYGFLDISFPAGGVNLTDLTGFSVTFTGDNLFNNFEIGDGTTNKSFYSNVTGRDDLNQYMTAGNVGDPSAITRWRWYHNSVVSTMTISSIKLKADVITASNPHETLLTSSMFVGGCETHFGEYVGQGTTIYGNGSVLADQYVDLSSYNEMRIYGTPGKTIRLLFNWSSGSQQEITGGDVKLNSEGLYSLDLSTVNAPKQLNAFKFPYDGTSGAITKVILYKNNVPVDYSYVISGSGTNASSVAATLSDASATSIDATGLTNTSAIELTSANPNCLFVASAGKLSNTKNVIVSDVCANLMLTDNKPFKAPSTFTATSSSYGRAFTADKITTVCLPFALTSTEAATLGTFYELSSFDGATLHFSAVAAPEANKAYLVKTDATALALEEANKSIAATPADLGTTITSVDFIGTLASTTIPASDGTYSYYAYNNGALVKIVTNAATLPAFRGYFKISTSAITTSARELTLSFDDDVTGISQIETTRIVDNADAFDLQGRRVAQPTKGLYIVNGKKVIIK